MEYTQFNNIHNSLIVQFSKTHNTLFNTHSLEFLHPSHSLLLLPHVLLVYYSIFSHTVSMQAAFKPYLAHPVKLLSPVTNISDPSCLCVSYKTTPAAYFKLVSLKLHIGAHGSVVSELVPVEVCLFPFDSTLPYL